MNPEWVAWAKEEIIAFHKIVNEKNAEIADLKTELREAGEIIASCIRESGQAEERGARKMAQVVCDECKRCQDAGEAQAIGLEELMQLWREGRKA